MKKEFKTYLDDLGVNSPDEILEGKLNLIWQRKYKEVQNSDKSLEEKTEILIKINNSKDELEKIDKSKIICLMKAEKFKTNTSKSGSIPIKDEDQCKEEFFSSPKEWKNAGDLYLIQLNYKRAIYCFTKALEIDNKYFEAFLNRAICNLNLKDYNIALSDFNNAIQLNSKSSKSFFLRGKTNFYLKNFKNAIKDLNKYISFEVNNAEAYFIRGNAKINEFEIGTKSYLSAYEDYLNGYKLDSNYEDKITKINFEKLNNLIKSSKKTNQLNIHPFTKKSNTYHNRIQNNLLNPKENNGSEKDKLNNNSLTNVSIDTKEDISKFSTKKVTQENLLNNRKVLNTLSVIFLPLIIIQVARVTTVSCLKNYSDNSLLNKVKNNKCKAITYEDGKYFGRIRQDKRHGQGTYTWSNGDKYVGEWSEDDRHGQGTFISQGGFKYIGEWKDDVKHGQGEIKYLYEGKYLNGGRYSGKWKDDLKHGQGLMFTQRGDKYLGEWSEGKRHGQGTYTWSNGDKYVGEWSDGKRHGQGTFISQGGFKYIGEYKNDQEHGRGTYYHSSGNKYDGEWSEGKRHGQGTFIWSDGEKYIGGFKDNMRHGKGTTYFANGKKVSSEWRNDNELSEYTLLDLLRKFK